MTRSETLQVAKPILFNTEMVRAIQDGRKTATRRLVKSNKADLSKCIFVGMSTDPAETRIARNGEAYPHELKGLYATFEDADSEYFPLVKAPYQVDDIIYVRETFAPVIDYIDGNPETVYAYKASTHDNQYVGNVMSLPITAWHPSSHMPKEAARIFLRVTGLRVERLQDISADKCALEGVPLYSGLVGERETYYKTAFAKIWDSTIPKGKLLIDGWNANPWVWVIEFERLEVNCNG